uniref:Uncharacterized protein n=1 Tax=Anguilla anguilla TaxID=7936 RepID=A0A0E9U189_ANGAN
MHSIGIHAVHKATGRDCYYYVRYVGCISKKESTHK